MSSTTGGGACWRDINAVKVWKRSVSEPRWAAWRKVRARYILLLSGVALTNIFLALTTTQITNLAPDTWYKPKGKGALSPRHIHFRSSFHWRNQQKYTKGKSWGKGCTMLASISSEKPVKNHKTHVLLVGRIYSRCWEGGNRRNGSLSFLLWSSFLQSSSSSAWWVFSVPSHPRLSDFHQSSCHVHDLYMIQSTFPACYS